MRRRDLIWMGWLLAAGGLSVGCGALAGWPSSGGTALPGGSVRGVLVPHPESGSAAAISNGKSGNRSVMRMSGTYRKSFNRITASRGGRHG